MGECGCFPGTFSPLCAFSDRGCGPRQADAAVLENIGIFPLSPDGQRNGRRAPDPPGSLPYLLLSSGDHEILKSGTHPLGAGFPIEVDVASFKPKENRMANQGGTHEQHVKAGQQSHKNDSNARSASVGRDAQSSGTRGGSHEQHVKAGQQSHKNSH